MRHTGQRPARSNFVESSGEMSRHSIFKGLAAGAIAGAAGSLAMDRFQQLESWMESRAGGNGGSSGASGGDPATVEAAAAIARTFAGHDLNPRSKAAAGAAMHYAMGMTSGAIYGALASRTGAVTAGTGAAFGTVLWAVADEGVVPALGLSKGPAAYPASSHMKALASHLVYAVTTELVRRGLDRIL